MKLVTACSHVQPCNKGLDTCTCKFILPLAKPFKDEPRIHLCGIGLRPFDSDRTFHRLYTHPGLKIFGEPLTSSVSSLHVEAEL